MGNRQTNLFDIPDGNISQVCNYYAEHNEGMSQFLSYLKNCSVSFKGYDSNSASPSDILEITDSKGNSIIMKYFLVNGTLTTPINMTATAGLAFDPPGEDFHFRVPLFQYEGTVLQEEFKYQQQVYELQVYKDKVRPLVQFNICPYFVDFYGGNLDVTYNQMLEFLTTLNRKNFNRVASNPSANELSNLDTLIELRFKRNSYLIANPQKYKLFNIKRPSILSETDINNYQARNIPAYASLLSSLPVINQYYGKPEGFLNQEFLSSKDFKNARYGYIISKREPSVTFKTFLNNPSLTNDVLRVIIFQICIAHYALYLSGVAHNDAHSTNIFIRDLGSDKHFTYYIDDDRYEFNSRYIPLLYDFDRSYNSGVDNLILENVKFSGQSNVLINGKDFMKSVCYVFKTRARSLEHIQLNNQLTRLLTKGNNFQYITDLGATQNCFFEGSINSNDNKINTPSYYESRFYTYSEMIKRMGGEVKLQGDFKFYVNNETDLKVGTNCYYLYPEFFSTRGIDTNILYEKIRNLQKNVTQIQSSVISGAPLVQGALAPNTPQMISASPAPNSSPYYGAAAQNLLNAPVRLSDPNTPQMISAPPIPNFSSYRAPAQNVANTPSKTPTATEVLQETDQLFSAMPTFEELRIIN